VPFPTARVAALAVGALLIAAAAEAGPARRGQVVRIERSRRTVDAGVHLCYQAGGRGTGTILCIGPSPPRPGTRIALVGIGSAMVAVQTAAGLCAPSRRARTPAAAAACTRPTTATTTPSARRAQFVLGLTGVDLADRTAVDLNRSRSPDVDPGERVPERPRRRRRHRSAGASATSRR
jgi:hypothetical protein